MSVDLPLFQLPAGGIDITPPGIANRGFHAAHLKPALQLFNLLHGGRLKGAVGNIVQLDEVDVAQRALAEIAECIHLGVGIVDAFNHGEFVGWPSASLLGVQLQCLMEANERVLLNAGHELVSGALDGRVE